MESVAGIIFTFCLVGFVCWEGQVKGGSECIKVNFAKPGKELFYGLICSMHLGYAFYMSWCDSSKVAMVAQLVQISKDVLLISVAILLSVISLRFEILVFSLCLGLGKKAQVNCIIGNEDTKNEKKRILGIIIISAVGVVTICSKSSFLYPLNDWVDANCFFSVGKSLMNGVVPYRDLFEQKGPVVYFVHGIAWLISHDSFLGIYFLEIIACFFFLYYSYKSVRLFMSEELAWMVVPITALLTYTAESFCHGDSVEEVCLPILMYTFYVGLNALQNEIKITNKQAFIIGVLAGLVFWTKFTMVGFFVGWFVVLMIIYLRHKRIKDLVEMNGWIIVGVLVSTIPFVIYFGMNNAIGDWMKIYIYDNLFAYSRIDQKIYGIRGVLNNLIIGIKNVKHNGFLALPLYILGGVWVRGISNSKVSACFVAVFGFMYFFIYMGGRFPLYYALILNVFLPFGVMAFFKMFVNAMERASRLVNNGLFQSTVVIGCLLLAFLLTPNRYLMGVDKEELPQYQFKEVIEQKEDPTLLNYGFLDGGFYTTCNIIPNCKAFCKLNIPLREMDMLQKQYVEEGLCDFVITRDEKLSAEKYEYVMESTMFFEGADRTYYLYQLVE